MTLPSYFQKRKNPKKKLSAFNRFSLKKLKADTQNHMIFDALS